MHAHPDSRPLRRDLDRDLFEALLIRLSPSRSDAADLYNRLRTRLVHFFEWDRCNGPEDLADEVVNRVARRIAEGEEIANLPGYFLGVARLVALESRARETREKRVLAEYARHVGELDRREAADDRAVDCLDRYLERLSPDRREQLLRYYAGQQSARIAERARLAGALGIGPVALRNRMLRMRQRLETCVHGCLGEGTGRDASGGADTVDRRARAARETTE
jgi:DNA-directed RNA polymerase specialized sigma24 family protein